MKKFICILFALILIGGPAVTCYSSIVSLTVNRLTPLLSTTTGGVTTIPARVAGLTSGGGSFLSWVPLLLPSTAGARLASIALGILGGALTTYAIDMWNAENNITRGNDGKLYKTTTVNVPNGYTPGSFIGEGACPSHPCFGHGIYPDAQSAYDAAHAFMISNAGHIQLAVSGVVAYPTVYAYKVILTSGVAHFWYYSPTPNNTTPYQVIIEMSREEYEALLKSQAAAGNKNANAAINEGVKIAADMLDQPNHVYNKNSSTQTEVKNILDGSVTESQKTQLETQSTTSTDAVPDTTDKNALTSAQITTAVQLALQGQDLSAAQIAAAIAAVSAASAEGLTQAQAQAAVSAALAGAGLSGIELQNATAAAIAAAGLNQAGIANAVKTAINDTTGVDTPIDPSIILPDKASLTAILTTFVAQIESLPMFQTLNGLAISASGTSNLCINMPSNLGGTKCFNAGQFQDELNQIGSVFLGLTTLISFVGIFKS